MFLGGNRSPPHRNDYAIESRDTGWGASTDIILSGRPKRSELFTYWCATATLQGVHQASENCTQATPIWDRWAKRYLYVLRCHHPFIKFLRSKSARDGPYRESSAGHSAWIGIRSVPLAQRYNKSATRGEAPLV